MLKVLVTHEENNQILLVSSTQFIGKFTSKAPLQIPVAQKKKKITKSLIRFDFSLLPRGSVVATQNGTILLFTPEELFFFNLEEVCFQTSMRYRIDCH